MRSGADQTVDGMLWQIEDELLCPGDVCSSNPSNKMARAFMEDYNSLMVTSLRKFVLDGPDRVAWAPSCFAHCENLCMNLENSPEVIDGVTYAAGLSSWFYNGTHSGTALIQGCPAGQLVCTPVCGNGCQDA
jgi:hypothetical protein